MTTYPDLVVEYTEDDHDKDGWSRMRCRVDQEDAAVRVTLVIEGSSELCTTHAPFPLGFSGLTGPGQLVQEQPTRREYRADGTIARVYDGWPLVLVVLANGWRLYFDVARRRFVQVDRFSFGVPCGAVDVADERHVDAMLDTLRRMAAVFLGPTEAPRFEATLRTDNVSSIKLEERADGQVLYASHLPLRFDPWRSREEIEFAGRCAPEHHGALGLLAAAFDLPA